MTPTHPHASHLRWVEVFGVVLLGYLLGSVSGPPHGATSVTVQVLHEPEEGQLVEQDLRDLHQQVLAPVLQGTSRKLTQGVLGVGRGEGRSGLLWD